MLCCAVLCCAVLCCAVLCCAVLWYAMAITTRPSATRTPAALRRSPSACRKRRPAIVLISVGTLAIASLSPIAKSCTGTVSAALQRERESRTHHLLLSRLRARGQESAGSALAGAMLCYAMLCYAMLCYAVLCCAMLCCAVLCCAMLWGYAVLELEAECLSPPDVTCSPCHSGCTPHDEAARRGRGRVPPGSSMAYAVLREGEGSTPAASCR
jgi:hypothetical protein